MQRILVTGGCGFIGSHLVRRLLREHPALELVNLDLLTYAGRPENLADVADDPRYRFVHGDIADAAAVAEAAEGCDAIINAAAETHVDRSIMGGDEFVTTNILGASACSTGSPRTRASACCTCRPTRCTATSPHRTVRARTTTCTARRPTPRPRRPPS